MRGSLLTILLLCTIGCSIGQSQTRKKMKESSNPLLCDIETGICETSASNGNDSVSAVSVVQSTPLKVIYFTDPICSSCWGIEPQLRKLKLEYGQAIEIDYRMGGLLPDWSYNSGGISKPSDVARHWDEVSVYYDMPIDGDVWLEDPLHSSYPPSIAFKAAQMQDKVKAVVFLRALRELLFLHKKNITKWEHLETAAKQAGLDIDQFRADNEGKANTLFQEDLRLARELGVKGFPSVFIVDDKGQSEFIYGSKAYPFYEVAILKLAPNVVKTEYKRSWEALFAKFQTLTAREFAELSGTPRGESEHILDDLVTKGKLEKITTKNGALWKLK